MKRECCPPRASRGFAALIEILVVAALIVGGIVMYLNFSGGSKATSDTMRALDNASSPNDPTAPRSIPGMAIRKARSTQCQENLRQIRMLVMTARNESETGSVPPTLQAIPDSAQIRFCPVGKVEYEYNSASGEVQCPFPGHERF